HEGRELSSIVRAACFGENCEESSHSTVGDPDLFSIENPVISVAFCACLHRGSVRAASWFGETEGSNHLSRREFRQVLCLLLICSEKNEAAHTNRTVGAYGDSCRGVVL